MYKVSQVELESEIHSKVEDILQRQIDWEAGFGLTQRRNGEVVEGDIRDTIDTGRTFESIEVDVSKNSISITFTEEEAEFIFGWRGKVDDIVMEETVDEFALDIVGFVIGKTFK